MERSEQVGDLIAALAKAQAEFGSAVKDTTNTAYGAGRTYKYADLAANIGAVRPALNKHGIALLQFNDSDLERQTASVTTSLHFGEQFISEKAEAPAVGRNGFDVQSLGACWTYLRRYTLQAICGLASEDEDGESLPGVDNKPISKGAVTPKQAEVSAPAPAKAFRPSMMGNQLHIRIKKILTKKTKEKENEYLAAVFETPFDKHDLAFCFHASLFEVLSATEGHIVGLEISNMKNGAWAIENIIHIDGVAVGPVVENLDAEPVAEA